MTASANSRWRRLVRRAGTPLALFALMIQVVVVFSHHHFDPNDPHFSDATMVAAMLQMADNASPHRHHQGQNSPAEPDDEPCLICMAIHAAAPPVMGAPPNVLPAAVGGTPLEMPALVSLAVALRVAAFESRGPPLA